MREMTYLQATFEAMKEEMLRDSSVFAMAEDINGQGGGVGAYTGLGDATHLRAHGTLR